MNSTADDLQELVKAAPFIDIYLDADSPVPEGSKVDGKAESEAAVAAESQVQTEIQVEANELAGAGSPDEAKHALAEIPAAIERPLSVAHPVSPLPIGSSPGTANTTSTGSAGSHADKVPADLYPALLRAHIALARVVEASRTLVLSDAPARFLLLKAAHADHLLCHEPGDGHVELPGFLLSADSANNQLRPIEQTAALLEKISSRVCETGINKQLLTELSLLSGNKQLLREGVLAQDSGIFASEYTGADAGALNVLIENWLEYVELSARNTDALIVNAIAYHQFLSMSPFESANSTAALAVFQMLLIDSGVASLPILALSESVHENYDVHYSLFRKLNEQRNDENLHLWLEHCIELITLSATRTLTRIHGCRSQASHIREVVAQTLSATHSDAVSQLLIEQPVTRIRDFVDRGIAKRQTSSVYLKKLCDTGVLKEQQAGKEKLFLNNSYLQIFKWDSGENH